MRQLLKSKATCRNGQLLFDFIFVIILVYTKQNYCSKIIFCNPYDAHPTTIASQERNSVLVTFGVKIILDLQSTILGGRPACLPNGRSSWEQSQLQPSWNWDWAELGKNYFQNPTGGREKYSPCPTPHNAHGEFDFFNLNRACFVSQ